MKITQKIALIVLVLLVQSFSLRATNWDRLVDLEGTWKFTVGDDVSWSEVRFNDSDWDKLMVPDNWDKYYPNYNGFGWYRKTFDMKWMPEEGQIALLLGRVDDVDEVFINGQKVGQTGNFPPQISTAYNYDRIYYLDRSLFKNTGNVIAVRVYDSGGPGGIIRGNKIGVYFDDDYTLLAKDLSGSWKFSTHREKGVFESDFDDSHWKSIQVPGRWESQGYSGYDGTAYYRTKFTVPNNLKNERLYLVLGKIDDMDRVYLNGEPFARTEYLDEYSRYQKFNAWKLYRVYRLPASKIKSENTLVVEVKDDQLDGGIYEGPIGIMTERDAEIILERNKNEIWDNPFEFILRQIFD